MGVSVGVRGWSWFKYSWTDTPLQISRMRADFKAVFLSLSVISLSNFNQHLHSQFSWYKRIWGIISKLRHSTFMICEKQKLDFSLFGIQSTRLVTNEWIQHFSEPSLIKMGWTFESSFILYMTLIFKDNTIKCYDKIKTEFLALSSMVWKMTFLSYWEIT